MIYEPEFKAFIWRGEKWTFAINLLSWSFPLGVDLDFDSGIFGVGLLNFYLEYYRGQKYE